MELTLELIEDWKWELAIQAQKCHNGETEMMRKKADFLEGAFTVLTCLERAMSSKPSPRGREVFSVYPASHKD